MATLDVSCEDYGLLHRLAVNGQGPRIRVLAEPTRTIMVGHWNGEEQGLNGSRAFATDHPEIVDGLQALFNQDNGTGRVARISMHGLLGVAPFIGRWMEKLPEDIKEYVELRIPGEPGRGGSDYASFVCAGAPAFSLSSLSWDYGTYTWHTNRDTFDKLSFPDLSNNATLTAMLAYLASEEPDRLPRRRRVMPPGEEGEAPGRGPPVGTGTGAEAGGSHPEDGCRLDAGRRTCAPAGRSESWE